MRPKNSSKTQREDAHRLLGLLGELQLLLEVDREVPENRLAVDHDLQDLGDLVLALDVLHNVKLGRLDRVLALVSEQGGCKHQGNVLGVHLVVVLVPTHLGEELEQAGSHLPVGLWQEDGEHLEIFDLHPLVG